MQRVPRELRMNKLNARMPASPRLYADLANGDPRALQRAGVLDVEQRYARGPSLPERLYRTGAMR